ncbi:MAG: hypothetical protein ACN2B6_05980 [Rickettsiales bacterium]
MLRKYSIFMATALVFAASSAYAKETPEYIQLTPYPTGYSFTQVATEDLGHSFETVRNTPITYGKITLALLDKLPERRRKYVLTRFLYPLDDIRNNLSGATIDLRDPAILPSHKDYGKNPKRGTFGSIIYANYDQKIGITYKFPSIAYKAYMVPVTINHIRAFTISPEDVYWDKSYLELDLAARRVLPPDYFNALLDIFIKGDFTLAEELDEADQELLVDNLAIALAEYHLNKRKLGNDIMVFRGNPVSREAPPLFNALLHQFYFRGGKQIYIDNDRYALREGTMKHHYGRNGGYMAGERLLNEEIITAALRKKHPDNFVALDNALKRKYADNFFNMIAYLCLHPELYDTAVRNSVQEIVAYMLAETIHINQYTAEYIVPKPHKP